MGKARSFPKTGLFIMCSTREGSGLTRKHLPGTNTSDSLFDPLVIFYNNNFWSRLLKICFVENVFTLFCKLVHLRLLETLFTTIAYIRVSQFTQNVCETDSTDPIKLFYSFLHRKGLILLTIRLELCRHWHELH